MECKLLYHHLLFTEEHELIDTLWNVNFNVSHSTILFKEELIDTLWNVNNVLIICMKNMCRINRYIMECK